MPACCDEEKKPAAETGNTCCAAASVAPEPAAQGPFGASFNSFRIEQMDCPTEQMLIQDKLGKLENIERLDFNLLNRTLGVWHSLPSTAAIEEAIAALGMHAQPLSAEEPQAAGAAPVKQPWWPLALSGVAALAAEVLHFSAVAADWVVAALALLAIVLCGTTTYKKGWIALKNLNLNINALMSIAVTGAVLIGQWPEAAMVMFLFAVAELIEEKSLDRARNAIRSLLELSPERATVQQADGSWLETEVSTIVPGELVRVRPGERIALDGEVIAGNSTVNQAPITGESLPVEKSPGDPLYAGTINGAGALEYRAVAAADDSTLARIIHAVEQAQGARAPTQRFVDRFARIYTPAVFVFALAVAVVPPLFMAAAWYDWIYRALVLLVVACPCALVISTPVTVVSGLAAAARKGILIKGGAYLESGASLGFLALDKTGTITHGKPVQTDYLVLVQEHAQLSLGYAASLAARSDHPVSLALARHAREQKIALSAVDDFAALAGRGVRGRIAGMDFHLGNHRLVEELGLCSPQLEATLEQLERQGKTVVVLCDSRQPLALFAVADTVKESSRQAIAELHQLGLKTAMLTGDNQHTAEAIASQVGIDEAYGNLLPNDKLQAIAAMQQRGYLVGMVGDGINDAPALASANTGFAMAAAGTDTAIETADIALMDDDLRKIPVFIRLSQQTMAILKQNIVLAIGVKALFLAITMTGQATMWMAVFADMGVSLLVVFNGLRLLKK